MSQEKSLPQPLSTAQADTDPGLRESHGDLASATGAFAAGVDHITEALQVVLGKFEESLAKQDQSNRRMNLIIGLMAAVALAMAWAIWRIEGITSQQVVEREASSQAAAKITRALTQVRIQQEKQPVITFEPSRDGGAKMVITSKDCSNGDCEHPGPDPSSAASSIEINLPQASSAPRTRKSP